MKRDKYTGMFNGEELAEIAYDAYGATTDYKNFMGDPMPTWAALPEKIQIAWCNASMAVRDKVKEIKPVVQHIGVGA